MQITRENLRKTKEEIVMTYLSEKEKKDIDKMIKEKAKIIEKSLTKTKPVEGVFDE